MIVRNVLCLVAYSFLGILSLFLLFLTYRYVGNLFSNTDILGDKGIYLLVLQLGLGFVLLLGSLGVLKVTKGTSRVGDWFLRIEIGLSCIVISIAVLAAVFCEL